MSPYIYRAICRKAVGTIAVIALTFLPFLTLEARTKTQQTIKIAISANKWNRTKLLEKLNQHGPKNGLKFELTEKDFEYQIQFQTTPADSSGTIIFTGDKPSIASSVDYDSGSAIVYDAKGDELFRIKNEALMGEDSATNGAAKQIIKRLIKLRSQNSNQK